MGVVASTLDIGILDKEGGTLDPVVAGGESLFLACPREENFFHAGSFDLVHLIGRNFRSDAPDVATARANRSSGLWITDNATVTRILADDNDGSRHQRFIVTLHDGKTVLIAHNIDLAPRVPVSVGDTIRFHGEYEWNIQGGLVHWTHHDPDGSQPGGWIEHKGKTYR